MRIIIYVDRTDENFPPTEAIGEWGNYNNEGHRTFHVKGDAPLYLFDDEVLDDNAWVEAIQAPAFKWDSERKRLQLGKFNVWWTNAPNAIRTGTNHAIKFYRLPNDGVSWAAWRLRIFNLSFYWAY